MPAETKSNIFAGIYTFAAVVFLLAPSCKYANFTSQYRERVFPNKVEGMDVRYSGQFPKNETEETFKWYILRFCEGWGEVAPGETEEDCLDVLDGSSFSFIDRKLSLSRPYREDIEGNVVGLTSGRKTVTVTTVFRDTPSKVNWHSTALNHELCHLVLGNGPTGNFCSTHHPECFSPCQSYVAYLRAEYIDLLDASGGDNG